MEAFITCTSGAVQRKIEVITTERRWRPLGVVNVELGDFRSRNELFEMKSTFPGKRSFNLQLRLIFHCDQSRPLNYRGSLITTSHLHSFRVAQNHPRKSDSLVFNTQPLWTLSEFERHTETLVHIKRDTSSIYRLWISGCGFSSSSTVVRFRSYIYLPACKLHLKKKQ